MKLLIYGAYGYTGALIAREAVRRGLSPTLAGRDPKQLAALAEELGLPQRAFSLNDPQAIDRGLEGMDAVLHCAGPFDVTAAPMAWACFRTGTHYLDITGEVQVYESLAALDAEARDAGVLLMPGVGFDVVPSDCLALHLKQQLPEATTLKLAFTGMEKPSRGTSLTIIKNLHKGGVVRKDGLLTPVPAAWKTQEFDFGARQAVAITIPWGDLATAWRSTGIPNIEVYMASPAPMRWMAKLSRFIGPLLGLGPVQRLLSALVPRGGPDEQERQTGGSFFYGQVTAPDGRSAEARLQVPESYTLTALTALLVVDKVLGGQAPAGFHTPAQVFGPDLVLEIEGVSRS